MRARPFAKDVIDAYNSPAFKTYAEQRFKGYKYPEGWQNKG